MNTISLDALAIKHKADKSSLYHNFAEKYDRLLSPFRESFTNVLEVGVGGGQSVRMWADYFPNAIIHGADIEGSCQSCESYSGRIKFHTVDQGSVAQLSTLGPFAPFDLIIDDGNHWWREQIVTFTTLFPLVRSGGLYIVEDSCTSYWTEYKNYAISCVDLFKALVDDVNLNGARGTVPVNPSPEFGNWEQGWHRREDCHTLPAFESIQFMNALIIVTKRGG
jgi:hypothetical protein